MIRDKNYDIFCFINEKKQIALAKNNKISFLRHFHLPLIKESMGCLRKIEIFKKL